MFKERHLANNGTKVPSWNMPFHSGTRHAGVDFAAYLAEIVRLR